MIPLRFLLLFAASFVLAGAAPEIDELADLPEGRVLLAREDLTTAGEAGLIGLRREGFGEQRGEVVWRVSTDEAARQPWLAQLRADVRAPVEKGERVLLVIEARAVETSHESDQARLRLVVADSKKPFPRVVSGEFSVDRQWRRITLPFVAGRDFGPGELQVNIDLGYGAQAIELAGVGALGFGTAMAIERLPRTRSTYVGHEPGAAWRREALERIERLRKGDLALVVTDAAGRPVANADVRVALASHAFEFGTAVNVETLAQDTPDVEIYRRKILELFNAASLENALKWTNWAGDGKSADYRERTFRTLAWLKENQMALRGHVMVWPGWRFLPAQIKALRGKPGADKIPELTRAHIRDIALATKDYITEWDVLNEPVSNHDLMDLFGPQIMVDWFKEAEAALPGVPLFLNDWGNHDQSASAAHLKEFEDVARYLREQGAPLGGLGLQAHIGSTLSVPQDILATLDRHERNFGLPIRITEFDVSTDDEAIQGDYTRDFLIAMFSHPSVVGVQFWGFWEGRHWEPKAALYRKDWTEKPNGAAYRKLVHETWRTDESGRTDADGRWGVRGFYGRYTVTVTVGGKMHTAEVQHVAGAASLLTVTLPVGF